METNVTFIEEAERICKTPAKAYADLLEQKQIAENRLSAEIENHMSLANRKERLNETAVESLSTDAGDFEKYKTALRKLQSQIDVSVEAVTTLRKTVLPKLESKIQSAKMILTRSLTEFCAGKRSDVETRITKLLTECVGVHTKYRQNCRDAFSKLGGKFQNIEPSMRPKISAELREELIVIL